MTYGEIYVDTLINSGGTTVDLTNLPSRVEVSDTAPGSPVEADLWWDSVGGSLYVYYGTDWVPATATGEAAVGGVFSRSGTTIQPQTAGDDLDLDTGDLSAAAGTFSGNTTVRGQFRSGAADTNVAVIGTTGIVASYREDDSSKACFQSFVSTAPGTPTGQWFSDGSVELDKGTFSTGVLFGTDTAAANTLDDYEEGTFTPIYWAATGGDVTQSTINTGYYNKIGNICWINIRIGTTEASAFTGYSGQVRIEDLPFASATGDRIGALTIGEMWRWNASADAEFVRARVNSGGLTSINLVANNESAESEHVLAVLDFDLGTNRNILNVSGWYRTA